MVLHASQIISPDCSAAKAFSKSVDLAKSNAANGLKLVKLHADMTRLAVFSAASFAKNDDLTFHLLFVILLTDEFNNDNISHYASVNSNRVTFAVLAAELSAAILALDYASTQRVTLSKVSGTIITMVFYTDSKSLFNCIVG